MKWVIVMAIMDKESEMKKEERVVEFRGAHGLAMGNTHFIKRDGHLITFVSGNIRSQVDLGTTSF